MKRPIRSGLLIFLLLCRGAMVGHALGEETLSPRWIKVENRGNYTTQWLGASLYVSDAEIWLGGNTGEGQTWLVRTNREGESLEERILEESPVSESALSALSKVGDHLALAYQAGEFAELYVGELNPGDGIPVYTKVDGNAGPSQIFPVSDGFLVTGFKNEPSQNARSAWYALVNPAGNVLFEAVGPPVDNAILYRGFTTSIACALEAGYAVIICTDQESRLETRNELIFLNPHGIEQWRVVLPEGFSPQSICATPDHIFVVGISVERNNRGYFIDAKATVLCYSDGGNERWTQIFPDINQLSGSVQSNAVPNGCVIHAKNDKGWMFAQIGFGGEVAAEKRVVLPDEVHAIFAGSVTEKGTLLFTCIGLENTFLFEYE